MSATPWRERLSREAERVHRDEEGSTIVFAAVTLFALTVSIVFVFQMGQVSADRLQMQSAADAAAYSGAQVQANALNSIAQINDGLTYINYTLLRHAMDTVVYATLNQYQGGPGPARNQYNYVLMGGDDQEGSARVDRVRNVTIQRVFNQAGQLQVDLYNATRLIAISTPRLIRSTAGEIARLNGATHIAFSQDMDLATQIGDQDGQGLSDAAYRGTDQDAFAAAMYERYAVQETHQITRMNGSQPQTERVVQGFMSPRTWFDERKGQVSGTTPYSQIRICWNKQDWDHVGFTEHTLPPLDFRDRTPNGHWHHKHAHLIEQVTPAGTIVVPQQHGPDPGGHGMEDDDPFLHEQSVSPVEPHHADINCVTCNWNGRNPRPNGSQSRYAEVKVSSDEGGVQSLVNNLNNFFRQSLPKVPLALRENALRGSVTVATWRPAQGIGQTFPASRWGMIAVASAQVGYQTDNGVLPLTDLSNGTATYQGTLGGSPATETIPYWVEGQGGGGNDDGNRNLYYHTATSQGQPAQAGGVRFGARLVPISGEFTFNSTLVQNGQGLAGVLGGGRWFTAGANPQPQRPQAQGQDVGQLNAFVRVESEQDVRAFWH